MTSISDNSSYGNELVLKGNSKEALGVQEKKIAFKNQIRPTGTLAVRAGDRFGSVLDTHSNSLLVGTANHPYDAAGANAIANAGAAWIFEKTVRYVARNTKLKTRQKQTFSSTGANQTFTVPENVDRITVQMIAGGGGGNTTGTFRGGDGAYVKATILVNPGDTYNVIVGQGGTAGGTTSAFGGGGYLTTTGGQGGSGGGRSAINHPFLGDLITAGAGGGAGKDGPGGFGGIIAGDGVTNKTVTHPIDYPVHMKGAKGFIYGYCEAANRYANYVLVGSTFDLRSMVSDNTYMDNKHLGGNASPATIIPGNVFENGAGGGGFAGGGAGPDGYGYRATSAGALTYYNVGGSGSGGSSMVDPTPAFYPMVTDEQMIYDVTAFDGGKLKVGAEFDGYGVGGTDTVPGGNGIVVIEWDEITESNDLDAEELWTWTQSKKLIPTGTNARGAQDLFGTSVAVFGDWAAVGAPGHAYDASGANSLTGAGAVYIFQRTSGVWNQVQKLVATGTNGRNANDGFGTALAFAGGRLFVGAPGNSYDATGVNAVTAAGAVFVYDLNASVWEQSAKLSANGVNSRIASDNFGYKISAYNGSIAISSKNGYDTTGATLTAGAGTVFVFENSGSWSQTARLVGLPVAASAFGSAINIKDSLLSVEASGNSTKYVFEKLAGVWSLNTNLSDSSVSNIVMYSRFYPQNTNFTDGINGVNMTFVNRNSSSYWDNVFSNDRSNFPVSASLQITTNAFIRLSGRAFANLPNFTFEQWYYITEPRTVSANETPNQLLPIVRRSGQWGLYLRTAESEANGGACVFEFTASDSSKKQFEFGTVQRRSWTHLAIVREGNQIRTYVNGDLRNSYDVTGVTFTDADTNITWGYDATQSGFQAPMCNLRDFKVRSTAAYRDSFTVNLGGENFTTIPAASAQGRGVATHILDSQTILSGLPNAFSDQVSRFELDKKNINNFQHVEQSVAGSGQLEITTRVGDEWISVDSPVVVPGHQQRRNGDSQFGRFVSINKDRLVVGAPLARYTNHSGEYNPSATGAGYIFDTADNFRYKTKVVQRSINSIDFASRLFGQHGIDEANRVAITDSNFGTRENVFFNLMYGSGTTYSPANVKKIWTTESTGRMTSLSMFNAELLARKTTTFKLNKLFTNTSWPASAVAYTSGFGATYSSNPSNGVQFGTITAPLKYIGDQLHYTNITGIRTNPNWDNSTSGFIAPLVFNGTNEYTYTQTFTYPGSANVNKYASDNFGYDVKTDGTSVFSSAIGSRNGASNNSFAVNMGGIHRYEYNAILQGWDEKELILPSVTVASQFFGLSFDIKGDYLIAKTTTTTPGLEVFKKGANGYEFLEKFTEGATNDPYVYNSARFFTTTDDFVTGSPDVNEGSKTGVGYGRHYTMDVDGTFNPDGINYRPVVNGVDDRVATAYFGMSLALKDGRVVIGAPQYNRIDGGASTRTNMGAASVFEKNEDGVWDFKALVNNPTVDASNQFWGSKVGLRGNRILVHTNSAVSTAATYTFDGTTLTYESRITNASRNMYSGALFSDTKFVGGNTTWTPSPVNQLAAGSFVDFNITGSTWAKGVDTQVPQHTNGAYEKGTIIYGSNSNVSLARNTNDAFGTSVKLSSDKSMLLIGAPTHTYNVDPTAGITSNVGAVFAYYWDTATSKWRLNTKVALTTRTSNTQLGRVINESTPNNFLFTGSFNGNNGLLTRFTQTGTGITATWSETFSMNGTTSNQYFGNGVAYDIARDMLYVGSPGRSVNSITSGVFETVLMSTSARTVYTNEGSIRNRNSSDLFGYSVSVHNGAIAVGTIGYDYDVTGTIAATNRGAVYTFKMADDNRFYYDQKITFENSTLNNHGVFVGLNDDYLYVNNSRETPVVFKRGVDGKFGTPLVTTPAATLTATTLASQTRAAWDKETKKGVVGSLTGAFNTGTLTGFGGAVVTNYVEGTDSFAVSNLGVVTQVANANGVLDYSHVQQTGNNGFGQTGIALSPDGSMLAIGAHNDVFNLSNQTSMSVASQNIWGKTFVYRWNARKNMFEYHSVITNPVTTQPQTAMNLSWIDSKLAITLPNSGRTFVYTLVDDRFWKLETTASMENTLTNAILTLDGNALVMAKPTSNGYPSVVQSGSLRTRVLNENVWGGSRGILAGADADVYSGAAYAGGGGGAGYIGGSAGGAGYAGGQGGSNLIPTDGSQILSLGAGRANSANANATGAGGNAPGAVGEDARIVITDGSTETIFNYTGFDQTFTVPAGVTEITVSLWGAGGGAANHNLGWGTRRSGRGGAGAFVTGVLSVVEGEELKIVVGGGGAGGTLATNRVNRSQDRKYGLGGLGGSSTNASIDTAGCGGGLAGIARGNDFLAIAGGGGGGSTRAGSFTLDGRPGGYEVIKDIALVLETLPDSDLVQAPGIINSRSASDYFGTSVAIRDDNQVYIGAPGHAFDSSGDPLPTNSGVVFEYKRINGQWQLIQKITSSKATTGENFGFGLEVTNDNLLVLGGRPFPAISGTDVPSYATWTLQNSIELFAFDGSNYASQAKTVLTAPNDLGVSLTLVGDKVVFGNTRRTTDGAKPSVNNAGGFTTFEVTVPTLTSLGSIVGDGVSHGRFAQDLFGASVEITPTQILVGAPGHDYGNNGVNFRDGQGAIFVFDKKGAGYSYREKLNLEVESELLGFGRTLKLIGDKLYAGMDDASKLVELTATNGAWTIARHIEAGVGKIAEIVNGSKLVELDSTAAQGVGTQPDLAGAGRAKTFTINPDGTLTDANMDYSVPGRSNGRNPGDQFGYSVYANHDFVVVGAPGHSFDLIGNPISKSGSLFVFNKTGDKWNIESKIAPDETAPIGFGRSLSGRNGWIITGNFDDTTGFARVIQRVAEGNWVARKDYTGAGETAGRYGASVAAADTNKFVVGIPDANNVPGSPAVEKSGIVEAYERVGEDWFNRGTFSALGLARGRNAGDWFGYSMSANRNYLVIGSPQYDYDITGDLELSNSGAIWIYLKNSQFPMVAKFTSPTRIADGRFGETVGIEEKTNTVVVGEPGANAVHIFAFDGETLTLTQTLTATLDVGEVFGKTLAVNAGHIAVGSAMASTDADGENPMTNAGATYVYALDASTGIWSLKEKIAGFTNEVGDLLENGRVAEDVFGTAVALDSKGSLIIGAPGHDYDVLGENPVDGSGAVFIKKIN